MYLLLVLSFCSGLESSMCLEYTCSNGPTRTDCIQLIGSSLEISPCVTGLLCNLTSLSTPTTSWTTVQCTKASAVLSLCEDYNYTLFTGEYCCVSSNCRSFQCTNNRCAGLTEGSSCTYDEDCLPEFYCNSVCTASITSECARDNMCPVGYACNSTNCIALHSMELAAYAERELFCKTGYLHNGKCDAIDAYVSGALLAASRTCTVGGDQCVYQTRNDQTLIDKSDCLCAGIASSPTGYCGVYANKSVDMESFYEAALYTTSYCSGSFAHTDDVDTLYTCGSITYKQHEYSSIMKDRYQYYNLYMSESINHCSRPLGAFDPWYNPSSYSGLEFLCPVLLCTWLL